MPRATKPRKRYRPAHAGRFMGQRMRDRLMEPIHLALMQLRHSADQEVLRQCWHKLVALFEAWRPACADRPAVLEAIDGGRAALDSIWNRHQRLGSWRPSGPELIALEDAVTACDQVQGYLRTDQISAGLLDVMRRLDEAANERRAA